MNREAQNGDVPLKILLIGAQGQVGWELDRTLQLLGEVIALDYPAIDLTRPEQIRKRVREIRPNLIVNAAAYTAVDKAEEEPDLAMAVNGTAPGILAEEAKGVGAALVHYSTDYVFDGTKGAASGKQYAASGKSCADGQYTGEPYAGAPYAASGKQYAASDEPHTGKQYTGEQYTGEQYTEEDTPHPLNIYGQTKLEGDRAVQAAGIPHLILRVSWVYGGRGKNFMLTILRLAREKEELRVVDDQIGSPTWCRMIAEATAQILAQGASDLTGFLSEQGGLYHLSAAGRTSWFGFAGAILATSPHRNGHGGNEHGVGEHRGNEHMDNEHKLQRLVPISSIEYPTPARRPAYSLLSSEALFKRFGLRLPQWEVSLNQVLSLY